VTAEVDEFIIGIVKRMGATRVSAGPNAEGVVSSFERHLERFMTFE